jgi:hypothetical protein
VALLALIVKVREWRKVFHQTLVVAHRFRLIDPLIRACLCMVFTFSLECERFLNTFVNFNFSDAVRRLQPAAGGFLAHPVRGQRP